jgi:hypothetical protein
MHCADDLSVESNDILLQNDGQQPHLQPFELESNPESNSTFTGPFDNVGRRSISRVPPEVWYLVFNLLVCHDVVYETIQSPDNPSANDLSPKRPSKGSQALVLSAISREWRFIVHSEPRLWRFHYIKMNSGKILEQQRLSHYVQLCGQVPPTLLVVALNEITLQPDEFREIYSSVPEFKKFICVFDNRNIFTVTRLFEVSPPTRTLLMALEDPILPPKSGLIIASSFVRLLEHIYVTGITTTVPEQASASLPSPLLVSCIFSCRNRSIHNISQWWVERYYAKLESLCLDSTMKFSTYQGGLLHFGKLTSLTATMRILPSIGHYCRFPCLNKLNIIRSTKIAEGDWPRLLEVLNYGKGIKKLLLIKVRPDHSDSVLRLLREMVDLETLELRDSAVDEVLPVLNLLENMSEALSLQRSSIKDLFVVSYKGTGQFIYSYVQTRNVRNPYTPGYGDVGTTEQLRRPTHQPIKSVTFIDCPNIDTSLRKSILDLTKEKN